MTGRITRFLGIIGLIALLAVAAALAQLPKNLDDDFISENKSTKLHGKSARAEAVTEPQKLAIDVPVIGKLDAIDALDTEKLIAMEGQLVTVQGLIVSTHYSEASDTRFFNFDKKREKFGFVMFSSGAKNFKHLGEPTQYYLEKKVQVTGVLTLYRGKPSMTLSKPDQIVLVR